MTLSKKQTQLVSCLKIVLTAEAFDVFDDIAF